MRTIMLVSLLSLAAACGQTGPLYLPEEPVDTEVEIRPGPAPASGERDREEEDPTGSGETGDETPPPAQPEQASG